MLKPMSKNSVDMVKYKNQSNVRRTVTSDKVSYSKIAIMTDADADG